MIKAGISGGIGSGKTLVCSIFQTLGVPVFHADQAGRNMLEEPQIKKQVIDRFGEDLLGPDGVISRKALSAIVFNESESLEFLNRIIHPAVRSAYRQWLDKQSDHPYTLYEAAILMESGQYRDNDLNILVVASEEIRIKRVVSRDKVSEEEVRMRMANQWDDIQRKALADFIICNDEDTALLPQVLQIHREISGNKNPSV